MLQTPAELEGIKVAGKSAERTLIEGARGLKPGLTEVEAAELFRKPLSGSLAHLPKIKRADGFTCCMSGPNSAEAYRAYARSRARRLQIRDLLLVHGNSCADGWTDITRTYSLGPLDNRKHSMYQVVFTAREPAFAAVKAGKAAVEVDQAANVGFSAIKCERTPTSSPQVARCTHAQQSFQVEPAIYVDGYGGIRHCDMVSVTEDKVELLTPFQCKVEELEL